MNQDSLGNTYEQLLPQNVPQVSINDLPEEIIIDIFSNLSPVDFKVVRLVCKKWNLLLTDKSVWAKAFGNRLGTGSVFASVTRSQLWLLEYFGRCAELKRWAKAKATSQLYRLINNEYGLVDHVEADFVHDRILTFAKVSGAISYCALALGKKQVFIPDDFLYSLILAYDASWSYLCWGKTNGEIYVKNLATSTSAGSNRLSIKKIADADGSRSPIAAVKINREPDKFKAKVDVLSVTGDGIVQFWNLAGDLAFELDLEEKVYFLDSDFKRLVVVLSSENIIIIDFNTHEVITRFVHGFEELPTAFDIDFPDNNIVMCDETNIRIFHFEGSNVTVLQGSSPPGTLIEEGTMQKSTLKRNRMLAGNDGLLYAITLTDGSVCVFNIRDAPPSLKFSTRIMQYETRDVPMVTKVALTSSIIAIGSHPNWIHFYNADSGEYLREGPKLPRKLLREGLQPLLKIVLGPTGSCGVAVCGDVIQYFQFGEDVVAKKRPNAPQAESSSKREMKNRIKAQMDDYNVQENMRHEQELLADKYNGTQFESEQEELRMAMTLSASYANTEEDLQRVLVSLRTDVSNLLEHDMDDDLRLALALSEQESAVASDRYSQVESPASGVDSRRQSHGPSPELSRAGSGEIEGVNDDDDDEILRRVLELLVVEQ